MRGRERDERSGCARRREGVREVVVWDEGWGGTGKKGGSTGVGMEWRRIKGFRSLAPHTYTHIHQESVRMWYSAPSLLSRCA